MPNNKKDIVYHLRLLSKDWPKGHWLCPCGSGPFGAQYLLIDCGAEFELAKRFLVASDVLRGALEFW